MFSRQGVGASFSIRVPFLIPRFLSSQSRHPPTLPPSLQLTSFPSPINGPSTPSICSVLSKVLSLVSVVKLSLEALNEEPFVPESNGEDLSSGYLQVPVGSVIFLTEAGIKEGKINEKGIFAPILTSSTQLLASQGCTA